MRKKRIHARLCLRRIKDKLRLPVFLEDSVIMVDRHRTVGIPVSRNPDFEYAQVQSKRQHGRAQRAEQRRTKDAPQPFSQIGDRPLSHDARL